jgi:hypothetical protein
LLGLDLDRDKTTVDLDPQFDLASSQQEYVDLCARIASDAETRVVQKLLGPVFKRYVERLGRTPWPVPVEEFASTMVDFLQTGAGSSYRTRVGFNDATLTRVTWVQGFITTFEAKRQTGTAMRKVYDRWEAKMDAWNGDMPEAMQGFAFAWEVRTHAHTHTQTHIH